MARNLITNITDAIQKALQEEIMINKYVYTSLEFLKAIQYRIPLKISTPGQHYS